MKPTSPCPACNNVSVCQCEASLCAFFTLLKKVNDRVIRSHPSSQLSSNPKLIGCGLDKLNAYFEEPISTCELTNWLSKKGLSVQRVFLKDRRPYLQVTSNVASIHLKLGQGHINIIGLVSNPNRFGSWSNFHDLLSIALPENTIRSAKISRLDLNMDFACELSTLIQSLDVANKRSELTYENKSGARTGVIIGKRSEVFAVYDKAKETNSVDLISRIELRLSGSKVPTRSIADIPLKLASQIFFKNLIGLSVTETKNTKTSDQNERLRQFKGIWGRDGFFAAKRFMNQSRNFDRDFANLIETRPWAEQPSELFKNQIINFFQTKEETRWMH